MQLQVWIHFSTESTKKLKKFVSNSAVIWRATFRNDEYSTLQKIFWTRCAEYKKKKRQNTSCIENGSQEYFSIGCCQIKKPHLATAVSLPSFDSLKMGRLKISELIYTHGGKSATRKPVCCSVSLTNLLGKDGFFIWQQHFSISARFTAL